MKRRAGLARPALLALVLGLGWMAPPSTAAAEGPSTIAVEFASQAPGTVTAMTLRIRFQNPTDPEGKPPAIRGLVIDAPDGTTFDTSTVPVCGASDAELMVLGPSGCPNNSQIGDGTVTVITGFGPPSDPFVSPTPIFNDGTGWVEISQVPSTPVTVAVTRLKIAGNRLSGSVAAAPGGPPDFQSAVSAVDFTFPASTGFVTTPATCPSSGQWVTSASFTFGDGSTQQASGSTPCAAQQGPVPGAPTPVSGTLALTG